MLLEAGLLGVQVCFILMASRFYLLFFICCNFLYASTSTQSAAQNTTNKPTDSTPIQDSILKPDTTPYKTLDKVYDNNYIKGVMNGFINNIEDVLLKIDIRNISLDFSNTTLNVSQEYIDDNISQFSGDSSTIVGFNADLALDYNFPDSRISSRLLMQYGLVLLRPKNAKMTSTETSDNILFTTGYTKRTFILKNGFVGPFIDGEYQGQFTRNSDGTINQATRYKTGIRMLDGKYIDELYLAGVGEIDYSLKPYNFKAAIETGFRAKTPITEKVGFVYQGFWRQYVGFTQDNDRDLLYNANFNVRLDVGIYKGFAFSPYFSASFAKIKGAKQHANNLTSGVLLLFSTSIDAISSVKSTQDANLKILND